jgi:hypothetical protein
LAFYEQDPAWRHRVGVLGGTEPALPAPQAAGVPVAGEPAGAGAAAPAAEAAGPADDDLVGQLQAVGFTVERLAGPPADGGQYNTVLEVQPPGADGARVINARVLTPSAQGQYSGASSAEVVAKVVAGLKQHLQPVPPPPPAEEAPPPPDPREVCRAQCETARPTCSRTCCEEQLDAAKCEVASEHAARCKTECEQKDASKQAKCKDGCARGKHTAYSWDTSKAREASIYFKCDMGCGDDYDKCIAACDEPEAAGDAPSGAEPAGQ